MIHSEIQGLRAVAALSVVLFHLGGSLWSGGFVGVDVFFVISGYLITSQLLRQIDDKGLDWAGIKDFFASA